MASEDGEQTSTAVSHNPQPIATLTSSSDRGSPPPGPMSLNEFSSAPRMGTGDRRRAGEIDVARCGSLVDYKAC